MLPSLAPSRLPLATSTHPFFFPHLLPSSQPLHVSMDIVVDPDPVPSVTLKRAHEQEEGGEREEGGLGSPFKIARTDDGGDSSSASPEPPAGPSKLEQLVAGLEDELWCPLCAAVLYGVSLTSTTLSSSLFPPLPSQFAS